MNQIFLGEAKMLQNGTPRYFFKADVHIGIQILGHTSW